MGEALAAGAKIYGYRVDHVHHDAYKMMGSFARNKNGDVEIEIAVGQEEDDEDSQVDELQNGEA